jgi:hypothetical protein
LKNELDLYKLIIMKKTFASSVVLFSILVLSQSCTKQSEGELRITSPQTSVQTIQAKISAGQTYTLNLGASGNISITRQASHFQLSEMAIDKNDGSLNYKYLPAANYTGADEVSLTRTTSVTSGSNNGCFNGSQNNSSTSTIITIKLNVTD